jgi:tRNA(His) 5'-end guanylyltransferase
MKSKSTTSIDFDALGDKHKKLEGLSESRLIPGIPVIARLDGRAFHTLTRNAEKPFDFAFISSMEETAKALLNEFNSEFAYVQSDEITLGWKSLDMFDGRVQKLCSVMAAFASVSFFKSVLQNEYNTDDIIPTFDCRIWQVPDIETVAENVMWREMDAAKNSISMVASSHFSPKMLHGISTKERKTMLEGIGVHWDLLPSNLKRGSFFKKIKTLKSLTEEELRFIPEMHRPAEPVLFLRALICRMKWERLTSMVNPADVLFGEKVNPIYKN